MFMSKSEGNIYTIRKNIISGLLLVFYIVLTGCASMDNHDHIPHYTESNIPVSEGISENQTDSLKEKEQGYRIQEGDMLLISVWRESDLREEVTVRPDGRVSFPLAGDVPARGKSFLELNMEITKRLREYLKDPVVSISLMQEAGRKVIVLGEVRYPGVYYVKGKNTMREAIALAKGFSEHAVQSSVLHIRGDYNNPQATRMDLTYARKETETKQNQNIVLQSEDIVYVPKKYIADVNYIARMIVEPIARSVWTVRGVQLIE